MEFLFLGLIQIHSLLWNLTGCFDMLTQPYHCNLFVNYIIALTLSVYHCKLFSTLFKRLYHYCANKTQLISNTLSWNSWRIPWIFLSLSNLKETSFEMHNNNQERSTIIKARTTMCLICIAYLENINILLPPDKLKSVGWNVVSAYFS